MTEGTIATSKRPFLTTTTGVLLGCLACCALWGSAFPCIKIGYALFSVDATDTASQMLFAGVRFMLAGPSLPSNLVPVSCSYRPRQRYRSPLLRPPQRAGANAAVGGYY